jgi:hypothetical protein
MEWWLVKHRDNFIFITKFSWAISWVKWSNGEKNQRFEDHLCPRPQGADLVGFFTVQPLDLADSLRELHYFQFPGKQPILQLCFYLYHIMDENWQKMWKESVMYYFKVLLQDDPRDKH